MAFAGMHVLGIGSYIMSLGGIAIALGAMVDAAIVMIETRTSMLKNSNPASRAGPRSLRRRRKWAGAFLQPAGECGLVPAVRPRRSGGGAFKPLAYTKPLPWPGAPSFRNPRPGAHAAVRRGRIIPDIRTRSTASSSGFTGG